MEYENFEDENLEIKQDLIKKEENNERTIEEINILKKELETLQEKYKNKKTQILNLQTLNNKLSSELELQSIKAEMEDDNIDIIKKELTLFKQKNNQVFLDHDLENEKKKLKIEYQEKIDDLLNQYNSVLKENKTLKEESLKNFEKAKVLKREVDELQISKSNFENIDVDLNNLKKDCINLKLDNEDLEKKIKKLKNEINGKDKIISSLRVQNKSFLNSIFGCFQQQYDSNDKDPFLNDE
jgi:chromosome segregation ATPase